MPDFATGSAVAQNAVAPLELAVNTAEASTGVSGAVQQVTDLFGVLLIERDEACSASNVAVRVVPGVRCPKCGAELSAEDFELVDHGARAVCQGCHLNLFTMEWQ
ncbi:hypothetical protein L6654_40395 [Bradyrhizobium sp. WYCCWR 13023]|uniref:Uncharacterized protein n=1 Tax=Bradyrhizobium zhengyangense TaxID=2911009 RepID=A0A9X1UJY5_9BRAD|nr:hypothetical protein [Bradyrhizobium zhengyangense]MCG2632852.1 hypothetical protein [Bradyrhizobium zhengyangense]